MKYRYYNQPRLSQASKVFPVLIISYEMLLREIAVIKKCSFDIIITDESHRLKNASSKTAQAIMGLNVQRRVALTSVLFPSKKKL